MLTRNAKQAVKGLETTGPIFASAFFTKTYVKSKHLSETCAMTATTAPSSVAAMRRERGSIREMGSVLEIRHHLD